MLVLVRGGVNKRRFVRTVSRRRFKIDLEVRSGEARGSKDRYFYACVYVYFNVFCSIDDLVGGKLGVEVGDC